MSTEVQTKKQAQTPSTILFRDDASKGFENVRQESLALPILKLLQNGSGEAQKRNQNYVDGACAVFLTATSLFSIFNSFLYLYGYLRKF